MNKPLFGTYKIQIENFTVPKPLKYNFGKQFMTNKIIKMKQKEILENLTGEKFPEPTEQIIQKLPIEGSPFWEIHNTEKQESNIIMGKWKLNKEPIPSDIDAWDWLENNKWNVTVSLIIAITTDIIENQNKQ